MSTRAQIIVKDERQELWFYRHSDGYPEGTMPLLNKFIDYVKAGIIRDNVEQSAGWLVLFGAEEYKDQKENPLLPTSEESFGGWKCGSIEPCACRAQHGDIEYLYTVDLKAKTISVKEV
jgi:hypothetical protein